MVIICLPQSHLKHKRKMDEGGKEQGGINQISLFLERKSFPGSLIVDPCLGHVGQNGSHGQLQV